MLHVEKLRRWTLLSKSLNNNFAQEPRPILIQAQIYNLHDLSLKWQGFSPDLPKDFEGVIDAVYDMVFALVVGLHLELFNINDSVLGLILVVDF